MRAVSQNSPKGIAFLILAQTMVGINIVVSKFLLASVSVLFLLAIRFGLATLILLSLHYTTSSKQFSLNFFLSKLTQRDWFFILAQALSAGLLFNFFMLLGLHYTDANVAGIITSTLPAIIALLSWIVLKERIEGKQAFCIFFATLGLLVIAYNKFSASQGVHSFLGDFLILFSLLPEGAYYVLCKLHPNRLPVFLTSAFMNGINAILILPIALLFSPYPELDLKAWFILFILGLSSGLFYVFWYFGCNLVDSIMASLSTTIMPLATVVLAWAILGEQLTFQQGVGMSLVLFSIVIYTRK